jgi:ferredoxin-thioredoxin reductase catalytic subunit
MLYKEVGMRINLENASKIIERMEIREKADGAPYCPCKPTSTDKNDICPCFDARLNDRCCCGLFTFDKRDKV